MTPRVTCPAERTFAAITPNAQSRDACSLILDDTNEPWQGRVILGFLSFQTFVWLCRRVVDTVCRVNRMGTVGVRFRSAGRDDATVVAALHADSWRRHYRGAYADSFLDGDVLADRQAVWSRRLAEPGPSLTVLAEDDAGLVGFVHVIFEEDPHWGSLIDNLHVAFSRHRGGVGSALLGRAAVAIRDRAITPAAYLWVLEQNASAQKFYRARGGVFIEKVPVPPPGGQPSRLSGSPIGIRVAWRELPIPA